MGAIATASHRYDVLGELEATPPYNPLGRSSNTTVLHSLSWMGRDITVRFMLLCGANVNVVAVSVDDVAVTPLDCALHSLEMAHRDGGEVMSHDDDDNDDGRDTCSNL